MPFLRSFVATRRSTTGLWICQTQSYLRIGQRYLRIALRARSASGLLDALGLGYDLPVGQAVYAIDAFPDDDLLWRIEWIGGVGYNTSVPTVSLRSSNRGPG